MERFLNSVGMIVLLAVAFGGGYALRGMASGGVPAVPPTVLLADTRPKVPVVHFDGIRNGTLHGSISGDVRVFLGSELLIPSGSGAIEAPADVFLVNEVTVSVPEGMGFVASSRGKKYYPVGSSEGENLVPKNRVYFETAEEAEKAGYVR